MGVILVMDAYIVKSLVEGVHLALYTTIKPGAYHRLRLESSIEKIFSNTLSSLDYIIEATILGEKVRKGELAAQHIGIGKLLGRALREAYRWNPHSVYPDYIVPQIIYAFALSYSEPESIIKEYGKVKKALDLVLATRDWREIRAFIDALKSIHRNDMVEHLEANGITSLGGVRGEVDFTDIARILASRWPAFISLDIHSSETLEYLKKMMETYRRENNAFNAIIESYLELVWSKLPDWARKSLEEAVKEGLMNSKTGSKKLFEIDLKLRRHGLSYEEYTGFLAIITGLAVYEGLRPA